MEAPSATTSSKLIGFKVFYDRDEDILEWWESIPLGERSHMLRTMIRAFLHGDVVMTPQGEARAAFSKSVQLAQVQADMRWVRATLSDMPDYLEAMFSDIYQMVRQTPHPSGPAPGSNGAASSAGNELISTEEAQRRTERILQTEW